jgi:hypothetical protein
MFVLPRRETSGSNFFLLVIEVAVAVSISIDNQCSQIIMDKTGFIRWHLVSKNELKKCELRPNF